MAKMLTMFFPCEVKAFNDDDLTIDHFISTITEDRSGDEVDPEGMVLNGVPSVLKQHGMDPDVGSEPVARCLSLKVATNENGAKGILARTQYYDGSHLAPPDNTGRRLYEKAKNKFMPYWSIGFIPFVTEPKQGGGRRIKRWECVEYSQVGVPDNAEAKGFVPSEEHRILDGTVDHRIVDGIDIDARYVDTYVKGFKTHSQGYILKHFVREFRWFDPRIEAKRNDEEFAVEGRPINVVYQKQGDAWARVAFWYDPTKGWTKELAEAHAKELAGRFDEPLEVPPAVAPEVKSLTQRLELDNAYRALQSCMETYVGELLYRSELPSEKEVRAVTKELTAFIEGRMLAIVAAMAAMREEDVQKFISDIIERKGAAPADPAPGGNGDAPAPADKPPAATSQVQDGSQTPPDDATVAAGAAEDDNSGLDFEVEAGASSAVAADDPEEPGIELSEDELKSISEETRTACATTVRKAFDSLRGKITED